MSLLEVVDEILELTRQPPTSAVSPAQAWEEHLSISGLVTKLVDLQQGKSKAAEVAGKSEFEPFCTWLKESGAELDKVRIDSCGEAGNGLLALNDVEEGEQLVSIPESVMMSTESAKSCPISSFLEEDQVVRLMPNIALALHLLVELHYTSSPWQPYIRVLPATYNTPLYWSNKELQMLKGSAAFLEALQLHKHVARQFAYFHVALRDKVLAKKFGFPAGKFTYADYRWAVSTVMTRQNKVPIFGPEGPAAGPPTWALALVPFWDMINHERGKMTTGHDTDSKRLVCHAGRQFRAGEQVFMHYGDRSNADFVVHQGFFPGEHDADEITVKLGLAKADPLCMQKSSLLSALTVPIKGDFYISAMGVPDAQLLCFARVNAMTEDQLSSHLANPAQCATLGSPDSTVSEENEKKALSFLQVRCSLLLRGYPTTDEEDEALLAGSPSYNASLAVKMRLSEKKILRRAVAKLQS